MTKKQKTVLYRIIASAILILGISILCEFADVNIWGQVVLYLVPYFVIGYDILRKAFKGILNKQVFDENFLMAIATVGAMLLGEFKEGVAVMLFYQIGELFQSCAVGKSRRSTSFPSSSLMHIPVNTSLREPSSFPLTSTLPS